MAARSGMKSGEGGPCSRACLQASAACAPCRAPAGSARTGLADQCLADRGVQIRDCRWWIRQGGGGLRSPLIRDCSLDGSGAGAPIDFGAGLDICARSSCLVSCQWSARPGAGGEDFDAGTVGTFLLLALAGQKVVQQHGRAMPRPLPHWLPGGCCQQCCDCPQQTASPPGPPGRRGGIVVFGAVG